MPVMLTQEEHDLNEGRKATNVINPLWTSTEELSQNGRQEYGQAWIETGTWLADNSKVLALLGPVSFAFVMIHQKCMRGLAADPNNDHFRDILGYMSLIIGELSKQATARST